MTEKPRENVGRRAVLLRGLKIALGLFAATHNPTGSLSAPVSTDNEDTFLKNFEKQKLDVWKERTNSFLENAYTAFQTVHRGTFNRAERLFAEVVSDTERGVSYTKFQLIRSAIRGYLYTQYEKYDTFDAMLEDGAAHERVLMNEHLGPAFSRYKGLDGKYRISNGEKDVILTTLVHFIFASRSQDRK